MEFTNIETWKDIPNYEGLYQASNLGNIKSIGYGRPKLLKLVLNKRLGYLYVTLWKDKKLLGKRVHRLIAQTFLENPEEKPEVNHLDGVKINNNVENLEWSTEKENTIHYIKNGLRKYKISEEHRDKINKSNILKRAKTVQQFDKENNLIAEFKSAGEAAKSINIGKGNIINCCNGKLKSARGFLWKYK